MPYRGPLCNRILNDKISAVPALAISLLLTMAATSGAAFELTPPGSGWTFSVVSELANYYTPVDAPTLHNGNLYGSTFTGGTYGFGSVFELMPGSGGWSFLTLYSFMAQNDGADPVGGVLVDADGNVYGTTITSGVYSDGVVFQITP